MCHLLYHFDKPLDSLFSEPGYVLAECGEEFGCNTCNYAVCDCAAHLIVLKEIGYVAGFDDGFKECESVFPRDERGADGQVKFEAFESDNETFEPDLVSCRYWKVLIRLSRLSR